MYYTLRIAMTERSGDLNVSSSSPQPSSVFDPEPRWQPIIAILATGGLYLALPQGLTVGPRWVFPAVIAALLTATVASHLRRQHQLDRVLGVTVTVLITAQVIVSTLPKHLRASRKNNLIKFRGCVLKRNANWVRDRADRVEVPIACSSAG